LRKPRGTGGNHKLGGSEKGYAGVRRCGQKQSFRGKRLAAAMKFIGAGKRGGFGKKLQYSVQHGARKKIFGKVASGKVRGDR